MKQFLSPSVLGAIAGLVFTLDKYPQGALSFVAILILVMATPPSRPR